MPASSPPPAPERPPLFLRAPWIGALWGLALLSVLGALALGRVRLPRVVAGVAVTVRPATDGPTLLLLLPRSAEAYVRPGHRVTLDTGAAGAFTVPIASVERGVLDARMARRRFPESASVLAHLDEPKLVARLERCTPVGCLTPTPGTSFAAVAALGTRTLASYAVPRS